MYALARCAGCDLDLAPDTERCPQCLRKSTVRRADEDEDEDEAFPARTQPTYAGVRAALALGFIGTSGLVAWSALSHERWLEQRHLWIAAIVAVLGMATIPLRIAFRLPSDAKTSREALRLYGLAMLAATAFAFLLAGTVGLLAQWMGESALVVPAALVGCLLLLVVAPVAIVAVRRPRDLPAASKQAATFAGMLVALVAALFVVGLLRAPAPAASIVLPADPKSLLDPMDLDGVALATRTTHEADGSTTRNLRADAGDMERTLLKLDVAALGAVNEVKKDASASGRVVCWVPSRLRTPENEAALRDEQRTMAAALESANARTPNGRAVRVSFQFGELW